MNNLSLWFKGLGAGWGYSSYFLTEKWSWCPDKTVNKKISGFIRKEYEAGTLNYSFTESNNRSRFLVIVGRLRIVIDDLDGEIRTVSNAEDVTWNSNEMDQYFVDRVTFGIIQEAREKLRNQKSGAHGALLNSFEP